MVSHCLHFANSEVGHPGTMTYRRGLLYYIIKFCRIQIQSLNSLFLIYILSSKSCISMNNEEVLFYFFKRGKHHTLHF